MSQPVAALVAIYELDTIEAYLSKKRPPAYLGDFFDALEIPSDAEATELQIAVAQILLRRIQDQLPQWLTTDPDGVRIAGRLRHKRPPAAESLTFEPKLIYGIDWAWSAPGLGWPETYYLTHIPGFDHYIVTASRDSDEPWGCTDHAIGKFAAQVPVLDGARRVITDYWQYQRENNCQARWASSISEGLVDGRTADTWADAVWGPHEELTDDEAAEA